MFLCYMIWPQHAESEMRLSSNCRKCALRRHVLNLITADKSKPCSNYAFGLASVAIPLRYTFLPLLSGGSRPILYLSNGFQAMLIGKLCHGHQLKELCCKNQPRKRCRRVLKALWSISFHKPPSPNPVLFLRKFTEQRQNLYKTLRLGEPESMSQSQILKRKMQKKNRDSFGEPDGIKNKQCGKVLQMFAAGTYFWILDHPNFGVKNRGLQVTF